MCGRYTQTLDLHTLKARFGFSAGPVTLPPRYNIAPTQNAPIVIEDQGRRLDLFRWGLIPSWAKDPAIGHKMINARAETVMEKPSYKRPFQRTRCLVVADSFYEWRKEPGGKGKVPMRILLRSHQPFAMAGLWDRWLDPAGKEIRSFTVITTSAAGVLQPIHDRMPVILPQEAEDQWLDPKADPEKLRALLVPSADNLIDAYEVSPLVNSPTHDVPACVQKVGT
jgi:putative SOS response-associated peptidase YedK